MLDRGLRHCLCRCSLRCKSLLSLTADPCPLASLLCCAAALQDCQVPCGLLASVRRLGVAEKLPSAIWAVSLALLE